MGTGSTLGFVTSNRLKSSTLEVYVSKRYGIFKTIVSSRIYIRHTIFRFVRFKDTYEKFSVRLQNDEFQNRRQ